MTLRHTVAFAVGALVLAVAPTTNALTEPCGPSATTAENGFFTDYESIEYSPDGNLIYHLKTDPAFANIPVTFRVQWLFFDDECHTTTNTINSGPYLQLPPGVSEWSMRVISPTELAIWDDQNNVAITTFTIPAYPSYTRLYFRGDAPGAFIRQLDSRSVPMFEEVREPPVFEETIETPEGCPEFTRTDNPYFDGYERAEYVDGLLRVHLRFVRLFDFKMDFRSQVFLYGDDCTTSQPFPFGTHNTFFPDNLRYYSFRMTSPTEWQLWNDETEEPIVCDACSGTIPSETAYVALAASKISAFSSLFRTTPFPPVETPSCTSDCFSNVLFIPGIKAVELYEEDSKRWLPGLFNFDAQHLAMTESGESVNNITVGEPIRNAFTFFEVYDEFFKFLDNLESTTVINSWQSARYDWRYDVFDVVSQDQQMRDGTVQNLVDQIHELAATSKNGKVTIVAHSNGGLVGKALIDALGEDADLVDKFVMVGTPQLGTPSAIAAMLHGTDQGLPIDTVPFAMSKASSREISENMPGAYGLLPLAHYFNTVSDSVVEFDDSSFTDAFRSVYGEKIDSPNELYSFLLGTDDGRIKPDSDDTLAPTILNSGLLSNALETRNALESWTPPAGIEVVQIVGWGIDTIRGFRYDERQCSFFASCNTFLDIRPLITAEGDQTVVSPSASAMAEETYYLNLSSFNHDNDTSWAHANLLAVTAVQNLLQDIITDASREAPYITTTKPTAADAGKRLHLSVHSPITIGIRDSQGRFTGVMQNPDPSSDIPVVVQQVPNTYYREFGEGKYVGFQASEEYEIVMQGIGSGAFTLEVEEVENGETVGAATYSDIPVSTETVAELRIQDLENKSALEIDENGDGSVDEVIEPDGEATSLSELIAMIKAEIVAMNFKEKIKQSLLKKIASIEKKIDDRKEENAKILAKFKEKISTQEMRGKIATADASEIITLLELLEAQSDSAVLDGEVLAALKAKIQSLNIKAGLKNDLLKRVGRLENKQALAKTLENLIGDITKKATNGKIPDADAQALLDLLGLIENAI